MAFLLGMSGALQGRRYDIDARAVTVGRLPENSLTIEDPSVSGRHCEILREEGRYTIRDLDSTNGTTVNNRPVSEQRLKPKDIIRVGTVELMFDGQDIEVSAEPPAAAVEESEPEPVAAAKLLPVSGAKPFGARRDSRAVWIGVISLLVVLALIGLVFFALKLFLS